MVKNGINPNFLITQTKIKPFKRLREIAISISTFSLRGTNVQTGTLCANIALSKPIHKQIDLTLPTKVNC